jgi:hypothetical protein
MKERGTLGALAGTIVLASTALLFGGKAATPPEEETLWPTKGWATASPASVGLDEQVLLRLDKDMASGKYSQMMDSFAVFRCGKKVFERAYPHDYAKIYGKQAGNEVRSTLALRVGTTISTRSGTPIITARICTRCNRSARRSLPSLLARRCNAATSKQT